MGGYGYDPQGSMRDLSSNNAARDYAANVVNYANKVFHQQPGDPRADRGHAAMIQGHGAPTDMRSVDGVMKIADPDGKMTLDHRLEQSIKIVHDYYVGGNGAHDWATWRHLLYAKLLPNLFRGKQNNTLRSSAAH